MRGSAGSSAVARAPLALLLTGALLIGCGRAEPARRTVEFSGPTMGATWSVKVVPAGEGLSGEESTAVDRSIRDDLARIEGLMSTWDPESELSRFNTSQSTDPFPVAPETFDVFRWAADLADLTGGALDVTVAPLVDAWGFGTGGAAAAPPEAAELARLRGMTGQRHLTLIPDPPSVRKANAALRVDFSSIAPGYAADRLASLMENRGFTDFLVDVGGELVARGRNETGVPWQVAVERPDTVRRTASRVLPLLDVAVATSGDYRNYREAQGERISHIIDPRTGEPIRHRLASATVVDPLAVRADGFATALMVLGPEEGLGLATRLDLAALLLVRNADGGFDELVSPRFEAMMGTP